ncbi:hypothetical protein Y032_0128g1424 [Ancylostoma ceylanicum]|uniref:Uncharacterized protein n=1 Tax=Ancylostoma ceylanicum TaxID=53326 RepID=A0A016T7U4_9BILA|nr:hypothetical protein Y032_0128g1424 [Ancylostoma ceylanicum]
MQHMKHCWAGHLLRRNDDKWSFQMAPKKQDETTETITDTIGRFVYKTFQVTRRATLDASRQESCGMEKLWFPLRKLSAERERQSTIK